MIDSDVPSQDHINKFNNKDFQGDYENSIFLNFCKSFCFCKIRIRIHFKYNTIEMNIISKWNRFVTIYSCGKNEFRL